VLVVSTEETNAVLPIVTILSLTSLKPGRIVYPIEALLPGDETGLPKDSIAMAHQIRAISKRRIGEKCGSVESEAVREAVRTAIRIYMDLTVS
jgi:mRNA interferase MazF